MGVVEMQVVGLLSYDHCPQMHLNPTSIFDT